MVGMRNPIQSGSFDADRARADRDFRMNPPKNAPGQGDDGWNISDGGAGMGSGDSFFGDTSGSENNWNGSGNNWNGSLSKPADGANNGFDNPFGGMPGVNVQTGQQAPPNQNMNTQGKTPGEMLSEAGVQAAIAASKGIFHGLKVFFKEFAEAIKDNMIQDMFQWGVLTCKVCVFIFVGGFVVWLLSLVFPVRSDAVYSLLISPLFSAIAGLVAVGLFYGKSKEVVSSEEDGVCNEDPDYEDGYSENQSQPVTDDEVDNIDFDADEEDSNLFDDELDFNLDFDDDDEEEVVDDTPVDVNSLIDDLDKTAVPVNMFTRQYLFETFKKVLPKMTPGYGVMRSIDSESDQFLEYEDILRESAELQGIPEDYLPNLLELSENLFMIQLKVERFKPLIGKEQAIANEIVSIYMRGENGEAIKGRESSYATVETVGNVFYINIFTGACPMVSLGDIYGNEPEFFLDTDNVMPYVWGINEFGKVLKCDIKNTNSFIISGIPRAGKSWKVQSLLCQLAMFNSPDEVVFYVHDVKYEISDYYNMSQLIPHFKGFYGTKESILKSLKWITSTEADRRKKLMASYGHNNIKEFKAKFPNVKLPYLYVIIDEMQSLNNSFTKEEAAEFKAYITFIISKYAAIGLRAIFIPHRITNEIISKQVYPLINSRACLMQTFDELKSGLEVTRSEFKYELPKAGDMALRTVDIASNKVCYCHGEVITKENSTNDEVYRYIGEVWKRILPGCDSDMVGHVNEAPDNSFEELEKSAEEDSEVESMVSLGGITIDDLDKEIDDLWG